MHITRQLHFRTMCVLAVALSIQGGTRAQHSGLEAAVLGHAQSREQGPRTTPAWLAWQVFHESLEFYVQTSDAPKVDRIVTRQFSLDPGTATTLRAMGSDYIAQLEAEAAAATVELQTRYARGGPTTAARPATPPIGAVYLPKNETLLALAQRDGVFQRTEARNAASLKHHVERLRSSLGQRQVDALEQWVNDTVAKQIQFRTRTTRTTPPAVQSTASGFASVRRSGR
jgi:hypothetical protein